MAAQDQLYCMRLDGYWMNIKKPPDFLMGNALYLDYLSSERPVMLSDMEGVQGNVVIDATVQVGAGCLIGPDVVIGKGCVLEDGVRLARCILLEGSRVCAHAVVIDSIVGWRATVSKMARL